MPKSSIIKKIANNFLTGVIMAGIMTVLAACPAQAQLPAADSTNTVNSIALDSSYERIKRTESAFYNQANPVSMIFVLLINIYQRTLSAREGVSPCQFRPSCSHFAVLAIKKYGAVEGTLMTGDRLLRCNPWAKDHYPLWDDNLHLSDPVEDHHL